MLEDSMDLYNQPVLVVYLSNDETMYINSSYQWAEIKRYVQANNILITNLALRFRSHWEHPVPANSDGYYFGSGFQGGLDINEGAQGGIFVVGSFKDGIISVQEWRVPELIPTFEPMIRDFKNSEGKLIINVAKANQEEQYQV